MSDFDEVAVLRAIKRVGEDALRLTVGVSGENIDLIVAVSVYERVGAPAVGQELSDVLLTELKRESELRAGYRAAIRILEAGDNNKRRLRDKLRAKGIGREIAEAVVQRMAELGYIREDEQAKRLAVGYARRNLWGPNRIKCELIGRGYSQTDAENAIREVEESGEISFSEVRANLIKRCHSRGMEKEKIRATLYRYGFGGNDD